MRLLCPAVGLRVCTFVHGVSAMLNDGLTSWLDLHACGISLGGWSDLSGRPPSSRCNMTSFSPSHPIGMTSNTTPLSSHGCDAHYTPCSSHRHNSQCATPSYPFKLNAHNVPSHLTGAMPNVFPLSFRRHNMTLSPLLLPSAPCPTCPPLIPRCPPLISQV